MSPSASIVSVSATSMVVELDGLSSASNGDLSAVVSVKGTKSASAVVAQVQGNTLRFANSC